MNIIQLQGAIELGLIFSLVAIGVYLSFRVLQFPDLTVDGSFPLGAAICATLVTNNVDPFLSLLFVIFAGAFFGWITAFLSNHLKMLNLLSGILTMSALYSINLRIMGNKPNISLLGENTIFTMAQEWLPKGTPVALLLLIIAVILVSCLMVLFLSSNAGLALRATGCNARTARSQGVNDKRVISIGLSMSNACVALAGALFTQVFGFADVSLGVGTIIIGLASVIIGESIIKNKSIVLSIVACVIGAILYRLIIALALNLGDLNLQAADLNLITAVLVTIAMTATKFKFKHKVTI